MNFSIIDSQLCLPTALCGQPFVFISTVLLGPNLTSYFLAVKSFRGRSPIQTRLLLPEILVFDSM